MGGPVLIDLGDRGALVLVMLAPPPATGRPYATATANWRIDQHDVTLAITWFADSGEPSHTTHLVWGVDDIDNRAPSSVLAGHGARGAHGHVVNLVAYESEQDRLHGGQGWMTGDAVAAAGRAVAVARLDCAAIARFDGILD